MWQQFFIWGACMYQHECFLTPKENFQGSKSHLAQNFIFSDPPYSCSVLLWSSCWHVFISFNISNYCNFTFMCCTKNCWRQWRIIPFPLTEGSWAPLVTKHHCLGRILDPWLPADSDMTSVNQIVQKALGVQGWKQPQPPVSCSWAAHHGGAGKILWELWGSGAGPQSQAAPD